LVDLEGKDGLSLNQERKDEKMNRILSILASFLSWFKTNFPPYLIQINILSILASFLSLFKTTQKKQE